MACVYVHCRNHSERQHALLDNTSESSNSRWSKSHCLKARVRQSCHQRIAVVFLQKLRAKSCCVLELGVIQDWNLPRHLAHLRLKHTICSFNVLPSHCATKSMDIQTDSSNCITTINISISCSVSWSCFGCVREISPLESIANKTLMIWQNIYIKLHAFCFIWAKMHEYNVFVLWICILHSNMQNNWR